MYASVATIRALAPTSTSGMSDDQIVRIVELVESDLDTTLAAYFYWPIAYDGEDLRQDPPSIVRTLSCYLSAAEIDRLSLSASSSNPETAGPYSNALQSRFELILEELITGKRVDPRLKHRRPVEHYKVAQEFKPLRGGILGGRRA